MDTPSTMGRQTTALAVGLALLGIAVLVALVWQVEVSDDVAGVRGCGSGFDVLADRSGWEVWWARDLDEPDPVVRDQLIRTRECPAAVNRQLVVAAVLAGLGGAATAVALGLRSTRRDDPRRGPQRRLERFGRITRLAGVALALGGAAALAVVVADADSTLFLYVDRSVVSLVGLVALVPALALAAIGHALTLVADTIRSGDTLGDEGAVEP